ncbi:MAG TPA: glycerol acyltransferase [Cryomorphaceae bacterium]|nr:glycerol acyltransferase [Cryomorphaceae bacterium]
MKKILAKIFLGITGWKIPVDEEQIQRMKHSVMVAAPHTSNWDFPFAPAAFWKMGVDLRYFIKSEYTRGPFGRFFKWTGALGVDRSRQKNQLTDYAIELLRKHHDLVILVPAEGSRKPAPKWRTGFYRIANEAEVPISMGYLDYEKKIGGVLGVFEPSGDFEKDMHFIQEQYRPIKGKHPENYNPQIF